MSRLVCLLLLLGFYSICFAQKKKGKFEDGKLIEEFSELGYSHFKVPARENIEEYSTFGKGYNTVLSMGYTAFHDRICFKK